MTDTGRRGFTLIELLVVIAIVALLVSILLPALSGAREAGRAAVCLANVRQVTLSTFTYANDYRVIPGTYWQGPINLDWSGVNNRIYLQNRAAYRHPLLASPLAGYIDEVDHILECPTVKRDANTIFDYTAIIRMAGARTDLSWQAGYHKNPARWASPTEELIYFKALPLFVEEHEEFYNRPFDDGSWAGRDQFAVKRHQDGARIGYLDGSVSGLKPPVGPQDAVEEQQLDTSAYNVMILAKGQRFPVRSATHLEFGWVNGPR